ncbi:MAG: hypothetical protein HYS25_06280 [Ignavibacteriales bacterium]|nr:hypothetical protein [Ignavibacteriales bacterium]
MNQAIQSQEKKYFVLLILFMLIFGIVGWLTLGSVPGPSQDEAGFQKISYDYIKTGKGVDNFHPESSFMPLEYGRLFMLFSGTISNQFGITLTNVRILSFISLLASIPVLFFMICRLGENNLVALGLTIAIASSLNFVEFRHARPEALGMLFILIILFLLMSKQSDNKIFPVCLLSALLIHVHLPYLIFAFAFCLIPFLSGGGFRKTILIFSSLCISGIVWLLLLRIEYDTFTFVDNLIQTKNSVDNGDSFDVQKFYGITAGFFDRFLIFPIRIYEQMQYGKKNIVDVLFLVTGIFASTFSVIMKNEESSEWRKLNLFIVVVVVLFLIVGRINLGYLRMILPLCYLSVFHAFAKLMKNKKVFMALFIIITAAANISITAKNIWGYRKQMDSLSQIKNAVENYIPREAKVLAKESLWFAVPDVNLVGVRDLEYRAVKDSFSHYLNRQGIQYIIDCNDLNINYTSGSPRNFINENGKIVYYKKFPVEIGSDMMRGQENHQWGVSDTLSFLSIITVNK